MTSNTNSELDQAPPAYDNVNYQQDSVAEGNTTEGTNETERSPETPGENKQSPDTDKGEDKLKNPASVTVVQETRALVPVTKHDGNNDKEFSDVSLDKDKQIELKGEQGMDKLHEYQGLVGRLHSFRDTARESFNKWRETKSQPTQELKPTITDEYQHIYRKKSRWELIRVSLAVMGIEFSYAAETAFVSPTLLQIGVDHSKMTLVWALSPLVGFFLTPVCGSLSDRCSLPYGRRRPFILVHSLGVILGLLLVPNGKAIGVLLGDQYPKHDPNSTAVSPPHPWGVVFTVLGTALLDFDADACQAPSRSYLLDVTLPEDHAKGLSTFTIMAGLGGFSGYALGGIDWDSFFVGRWLGGNVRAVFTLITFIFIICVFLTVTSFKEIPLDVIETRAMSTDALKMEIYKKRESEDKPIQGENKSYGTVGSPTKDQETSFAGSKEGDTNGYVNYGFDEQIVAAEKGIANEVSTPTLKEYLWSTIYMPKSMRILCLTNLFCWMAHVCYSLYFTDYVAESVFGGDPQAHEGSEGFILYESGIRFGCWGMALYSLSCACYSTQIEKLIRRFKARRVYVGGLLFYSVGMLLMAALNSRLGVIMFSWTAGVMYSTLFTMPYLLVAHYHASNKFANTPDAPEEPQTRGLGTDIAIVSSMVFLAQFILSLVMGSLIKYIGSTTTIVCVASFLAFCGAITATQVLYLDL